MSKKLGRPKVIIKQDEFEKLCAMQCTKIEIASWFKCCDDTIEAWCKETYNEHFSAVYKRLSAFGRISLRRNQFRMSENNCTMAIWLGKQYLDQKEQIDTNITSDGMLNEILGYMKNNGKDKV